MRAVPMLLRRVNSWAASCPPSNSLSLIIAMPSLPFEKGRPSMIVVTDLEEMKLELHGVGKAETYSEAFAALK